MTNPPVFLASLGCCMLLQANFAQAEPAAMRPLNPANRPVDSSLFVPSANAPRPAGRPSGSAVLQAPLPANAGAASQEKPAAVPTTPAAGETTAAEAQGNKPQASLYQGLVAKDKNLPLAAQPAVNPSESVGALPALKQQGLPPAASAQNAARQTPTAEPSLLPPALQGGATLVPIEQLMSEKPANPAAGESPKSAQNTPPSATPSPAAASAASSAIADLPQHPTVTIKAAEIQKPAMPNVPLQAERQAISWFAPKLLHGCMPGWQVVSAEHLPAHKLSVRMQDGSMRQLDITPMLLAVADTQGGEHFQVIEPGFEAKRAYRQRHTVTGALENSIAGLQQSAQQIDQAARQLEQLLQALPSPPQPEPEASEQSAERPQAPARSNPAASATPAARRSR